MKRITTILIAMLVAFLMGGSWAWATPPGNETKTGLCHRTASDSNPYVFIEVDDNSLQSHLTDSKGHFPKPWKSDGVFRGVAHVKGDLKYDYEATSAEDCVDNTPVKPEPEVATDTEQRMSCKVGLEERTVTTTTEYVWNGEEWVLGQPEVVNGEWTFVRNLTKAELVELECIDPLPITSTLKLQRVTCDGYFLKTITVKMLDGQIIEKKESRWIKTGDLTKKDEKRLECSVAPEKPEKPEPQKPQKPAEELPHTGGNLAAAGIAAALLAAGSGLVWFSRRRLTDV